MKWRYLDTDPASGARNYHALDQGKTIIRTEHDKDEQIALRSANKSQADSNKYNFMGKDDGDGMRHVARIPMLVIQQWAEEGIDIFDDNDWPEIQKRLNDPSWRYLRTSSEKL